MKKKYDSSVARITWTHDLKNIDPSKKIDLNTDTRYLLVIEHINRETRETNYHNTRQILNEEGVQKEVKLALTFDPEFQKLYIHSISILRGDNS